MHKLLPLSLVPLTFLHGVTTQESKKDSAPPAKEAEWVTFDDAGIKVLVGYLKEEKREIVLLMALDTLARMGAQASIYPMLW
jgi:hypothetical protein